MPPDNISTGEMKCFFCEDGKETPINTTFAECTPEDLMGEITDTMQKIYNGPRYPIPTHITADLECKPKKIKDFICDLQTLLATHTETIEKYRNHKIPRRQRMIRKAAKMNKHKIYVWSIPSTNQIEKEFFYPERRQKNDDAD
ncbi:MAG: hypothetical protein IJ657_00185 [Acidaminococcaceae bacterium]|nr:hypothetical protein [Acidaminococcaceae bacterium]